MAAFFFIVLVTSLSIFFSYSISEEITWFTYYLGGLAGLFLSSLILEAWNKRKKKKDEVLYPKYEI